MPNIKNDPVVKRILYEVAKYCAVSEVDILKAIAHISMKLAQILRYLTCMQIFAATLTLKGGRLCVMWQGRMRAVDSENLFRQVSENEKDVVCSLQATSFHTYQALFRVIIVSLS